MTALFTFYHITSSLSIGEGTRVRSIQVGLSPPGCQPDKVILAGPVVRGWGQAFFFFFCLSKKRNKKKTARKETALSSHRFPIKLLNYCGEVHLFPDVVDWLARVVDSCQMAVYRFDCKLESFCVGMTNTRLFLIFNF